VPAARFAKLGRVERYLPELREASAKRVQADSGFALLAEAITRVKKNIATKTVSLNEKERRDDIAKSKVLEDKLKQESRKLRMAQPLTYEITLANAGKPGLPAPVKLAAQKEKKAPAAAPGTVPEDSEAGDDLAGDASGHTPADDIIVSECERILVDYVKRVGGDLGARLP